MIKVSTLRIILSNLCNLRCFYCFNEGYPRNDQKHNQLLGIEDYLTVIDYLAKNHGLSKVKLTGGEPFLSPMLNKLMKEIISRFPELKIGITSNGSRPDLLRNLLNEDYASKVKINISLPTINADKFKAITGTNLLNHVLESINLLVESNHEKKSIDTVLMLNSFVDDAYDVIEYAKKKNIGVKLLCLNSTPVNKMFLEEYFESNYLFDDAVKFISRTKYILSKIDNEHSATFKNDGHIIKILSCNDSDPLDYFSKYRSLRVYFDGHVAVTGSFDGFWKEIEPDGCNKSIEEVIRSLEKRLIEANLPSVF